MLDASTPEICERLDRLEGNQMNIIQLLQQIAASVVTPRFAAPQGKGTSIESPTLDNSQHQCADTETSRETGVQRFREIVLEKLREDHNEILAETVTNSAASPPTEHPNAKLQNEAPSSSVAISEAEPIRETTPSPAIAPETDKVHAEVAHTSKTDDLIAQFKQARALKEEKAVQERAKEEKAKEEKAAIEATQTQSDHLSQLNKVRSDPVQEQKIPAVTSPVPEAEAVPVPDRTAGGDALAAYGDASEGNSVFDAVYGIPSLQVWRTPCMEEATKEA